MALIPEDRKTEGLMLPMTVRDNLSFAALDRLSRAGVIDRAAEQRLIDDMVRLCWRSRRPDSTFRSARCPAATSRRWSSPNG